jgi:adenosylcobinamide-GDP ribazoletransferase
MNFFLLAISFLTIIPVKLKGTPQPGDFGRSALWFPFVGVAVGGLSALSFFILEKSFSQFLGAVLTCAVWIGLTGGLHLDGLADCFDGMLNASSPQRRLEIMKDPRLGTFGGIGLVLAILIKVAILSSFSGPASFVWFPLAAATGRWLLLPAGKQPLARPGGMGAGYAIGLSARVTAAASIPLIVLVVLVGWPGLVAVGAAHLAAWAIFGFAKRRLGGITGDVMGLTVEMGELVVLFTGLLI